LIDGEFAKFGNNNPKFTWRRHQPQSRVMSLENLDLNRYSTCRSTSFNFDPDISIYIPGRPDPDRGFAGASYNRFWFSQFWAASLERRQPEGVATVLDPEHTQEEGVHSEKDSTPDEDSNLLLARVGNAGDFECQANGGEGKNSVCEL
jgi:hypothetical protein